MRTMAILQALSSGIRLGPPDVPRGILFSDYDSVTQDLGHFIAVISEVPASSQTLHMRTLVALQCAAQPSISALILAPYAVPT